MAQLSLNVEQRGFEYGVKHLLSPVCENGTSTLVNVLAPELSISPAEIQDLLSLGAIYINSQRARPEDLHLPVAEGTYLRVHTKPRRFPPNDHQWAKRIVFQNDDFMVVNKISALPCHPSVDNTQENVLAYLREDFGQEFFLTHRLDVPTNGLLVVAKNKEFQSLFNTMLQRRSLDKIYRAVCVGTEPRLGIYRHYMKPSPRAPKEVVREETAGFALCELEVLSCEALGSEAHATDAALAAPAFQVKIKLMTGRTHQIRAQLSAEGSPLRGDHMYGSEKIYSDEQIDLTACELSFTDPRTGALHHFQI